MGLAEEMKAEHELTAMKGCTNKLSLDAIIVWLKSRCCSDYKLLST